MVFPLPDGAVQKIFAPLFITGMIKGKRQPQRDESPEKTQGNYEQKTKQTHRPANPKSTLMHGDGKGMTLTKPLT